MGWKDRPRPSLEPAQAPAQLDPPHQAEPWRVGDLAECTYGGPWFAGGIAPDQPGPQAGEVRPVVGVEMHWYPGMHCPAAFLVFERYRPRSYIGHSFSKVTPRADQLERADPDFLAAYRLEPLVLGRVSRRWLALASRLSAWMAKAAAVILLLVAVWALVPAIAATLTRVPA